MKELSLDEVHRYCMGCLLYFDKICRKYGLKYSVYNGTLLGAVRHHGFIPWDDDVDVMMLRSDYEKFFKIMSSGEESDPVYELLDSRTHSGYNKTIGRMVDKRTQIHMIEDRQSGSVDVRGLGVFLDIYPMDGIPAGKKSWHAIKKMALVVLYGIVAPDRKEPIVTPKGAPNWMIMRSAEYMVYKMRLVFGRDFFYKLFYGIVSALPEDTEYITCLWEYMNFSPFRREWMSDIIDYDFEGHKIMGVRDYDSCLRAWLDNQGQSIWERNTQDAPKTWQSEYMVMPPPEFQIPHHSFRAFLLDNEAERDKIMSGDIPEKATYEG